MCVCVLEEGRERKTGWEWFEVGKIVAIATSSGLVVIRQYNRNVILYRSAEFLMIASQSK